MNMAKITIQGIVLDLPNFIDPNLVLDPISGKKWVNPDSPDIFVNTISGGVFAGPQPNSFDATPLQKNPILVNVIPVSASDPTVGGQRIPNSSVTFKNPS